jgi:hypothetical protein
LENRKKNCSQLIKKCYVEEGGASSSRVKKEWESTITWAQKMMRARVEPSIMATMVWAMPIMV